MRNPKKYLPNKEQLKLMKQKSIYILMIALVDSIENFKCELVTRTSIQ